MAPQPPTLRRDSRPRTRVVVACGIAGITLLAGSVNSNALGSPTQGSSQLGLQIPDARPLAMPEATDGSNRAKTRTSIIVEGNAAGRPLRRAKASVTTLSGHQLRIVGGPVKTDASGMAAFSVRGRLRSFVVTLSGGGYGYAAQTAKRLRGSVSGIGSTDAVSTMVSPETGLAVAELRSGGSTTVRQAVARTQRFLRLPDTGSAFDLGFQTGADGQTWPARDFDRLVRQESGYQSFATDSAQRVGRAGQFLWSAKEQRQLGAESASWSAKLFKGILGFFKGGVGNLINFGLCQAANALPPGAATFAGIFLDCGGGTDLTEVNKKLDDIQKGVTDLSTLVKNLDAQIKEQKFGQALDRSQLQTLLDQLTRTEAAQKVLATTASQKPTGTEPLNITSDALCAKAYGGTKSAGQTPYNACKTLGDTYALFTEEQPHAADTLYHALGDTSDKTYNLVARFQDALGGGDKFIGGAAQRNLLQFYAQALTAQQSAFLASITWTQFRQSWTGDEPTCEPLAQGDMAVASPRLLDDSCQLAATALHDLSVELFILENGPQTDVDPQVLIDPATGFSWWRYAFDGSGQTLREANPAKPFFAAPNDGSDWSQDGLARKVYSSVADGRINNFGLPGGTDQQFQIADNAQNRQLVTNLRTGTSPTDSVAKLLRDKGFEGPATESQDKASRGMDWQHLGLDFQQWRFDKPGSTISWTYQGDHYWGGYLDDKGIAGLPCDTREGHAKAIGEQYLWPYLPDIYGCSFVGWGGYALQDARSLAMAKWMGVWASHMDGGDPCRALDTEGSSNGAAVTWGSKPLCTRDTFGLLVDPTDVRWTDAIFDRVKGRGEIPALVLPPFVLARPQTAQEAAFKSISYQVSGSQNYDDENARVFLQCASNTTFTNPRERELNSSPAGTGVVTRTTPVTGESGNWCRIRAVNSGGDTVSGGVKIK